MISRTMRVRVIRRFGLWLAAIALIAWFNMSSSLSQDLTTSEQPTAPIVIDGRAVLNVGGIAGFPAKERAEFASQVLSDLIRSTPPTASIRVDSLKRGDLITLRANTRHLLTITDADVIAGIEMSEQAQIWQQRIQQTLQIAQQHRTAAYQRMAVLLSLAILAGAIALHVVVQLLKRYLRRRDRRTSAIVSDSSRIWLRNLQIGALALQIGIWIAALHTITERFPWTRSVRYRALQFLKLRFTEPILVLAGESYSLLDLLQWMGLAIALWLAVRSLTLLVKSRFLNAAGVNRGIQDAIAITMQFILISLGILIILQANGVDVSSLTILASVLGVGIGFGLQNIANNFISGLIILLERPIQIGDFINLGDLFGTVERIGVRSTEIRTLDQVTIIVPNSEFIETKVVNWSHGHPVSRLHVPLGVAYGSDITKVSEAVLEAAQNHSDVLGYPQPQLWFLGFGESELSFDLLVWIRDPRSQFQIKSDLYYLIEANLRRYDIEIPFPQRDLHVRSPKIEEAIATWMQHQSAPAPTLYYPGLGNIPRPRVIDSKSSPAAKVLHPELSQCILPINQRGGITADVLQSLVDQMRGPDGVDIKDRRHRLNVYPQCFIGTDAVHWLMRTQKATHTEALRIGQMLIDRGLMHHVVDEHDFEDAYLFYRFYEDEGAV